MQLKFRNFLILIISFIAIQHTLAAENTLYLWGNASQTQIVNNQAEQTSKSGAIRHITMPRMQIYQPEISNHVALLIMSGGGYAREELGKEGTPAALYFQKKGFTVFELIYRLPNQDGNNQTAPFADGQRAIRIIRSKAKEFDIDANKIGVLGFSAGGHLAGILATHANYNFYTPVDQIDHLSAAPDFAVLLYPVISMQAPLNTTRAFKTLVGKNSTASEQRFYSVDQQVTSSTPPMFIAQAIDDPIAAVENSLKMQAALDKNNVQHEVQIFKTGGHGWGMGKKETPTTEWPSLLLKWLKNIGIL